MAKQTVNKPPRKRKPRGATSSTTRTSARRHPRQSPEPDPSAKVRTKVLIVDDHPLVREGLAALIAQQSDLEVCGEAADVSGAMKLFESTKPDLVIIDIFLKNGNGLDLIKRIRTRDESVKMLVSSMHDENLYAERVLHAGARGYVNKEEGRQTMIKAIRRVLSGKIYVSDELTERMLPRAFGGPQQPEQSPVERLSNRELQVFEYFGQGLPPREIAKRLNLSPKTIETYRDHIKCKLNLKTSGEMNRYAVEWLLGKS